MQHAASILRGMLASLITSATMQDMSLGEHIEVYYNESSMLKIMLFELASVDLPG